MKRDLIEVLEGWTIKEDRKPLVLQGARQVGKTWLLQELGDRCYQRVWYANLEAQRDWHGIFLHNLDGRSLVQNMSLAAGFPVDQKGTLVILDEIQACPPALTALKYLYEDMPNVHVAVAGSLLGVALYEGASFPVGKVDTVQVPPLTFDEFLDAVGQAPLADALRNRPPDQLSGVHEVLISFLNKYMMIGGMPEAVRVYAETEDALAVREVQHRLLEAYELDFSKHAPEKEVPRIRMIWNALPSQLAKENAKFIYGALRPGARAKDYETALLWLEQAGLIHRLPRCTVIRMPLKAWWKEEDFKVYAFDVGILAAMADLPMSLITTRNRVFSEFSGRLTEQFVLQQLKAKGINPAYWRPERKQAEVDFIWQQGTEMIALEAKAGVNLKAKSLRVLSETYPEVHAWRTSLRPYREQDWVVNKGLYQI